MFSDYSYSKVNRHIRRMQIAVIGIVVGLVLIGGVVGLVLIVP